MLLDLKIFLGKTDFFKGTPYSKFDRNMITDDLVSGQM